MTLCSCSTECGTAWLSVRVRHIIVVFVPGGVLGSDIDIYMYTATGVVQE